MNQQKLFSCNYSLHEYEEILGFCLNLECNESRSQFCLQCATDPNKHTNCKKDLQGFGSIQILITNFKENLLNLTNSLNESFALVKTKVEECSKQMEIMNSQLINISEALTQKDYQQIKQNLQMLKELYQYINNQEMNVKQNQLGTQLFKFKQIIQALNQDQYQEQSTDSKQDYQNKLKQGIELLNKQKWEKANQFLSELIYQMEKLLPLANFFLSISLYEQNEAIKGYQLRQQIKKINQNLYKDILDYSETELRKNPKNTLMLIAKSYALNEESQYYQAISQCETILKEDPQHLHAIYRKSLSLINLKEYSQAITCLDQALEINPQYIIAYNNKGLSLYGLKQFKEAIFCFDKAIQLDPNFSEAYNNKGLSLYGLKQFENAIICFDKAIQLDPSDARAYNNKGNSLYGLQQYKDAIICYDKAIQLDPNDAKAQRNRGNLLSFVKKYNQAPELYEKAIQQINN